MCEILLEDLIGVQIGSAINEKACELVIHYFPLVTKKWAKKRVRRLVETTIQFDEEESYDDNATVAGKWKTMIMTQAVRATKLIFEQGSTAEQEACSASSEGEGIVGGGGAELRASVVYVRGSVSSHVVWRRQYIEHICVHM